MRGLGAMGYGVSGSGDTPQQADKKNNTDTARYYLFGPDQLPIGSDKKPLRLGDYSPSGSCKELLADYQRTAAEVRSAFLRVLGAA